MPAVLRYHANYYTQPYFNILASHAHSYATTNNNPSTFIKGYIGTEGAATTL